MGDGPRGTGTGGMGTEEWETGSEIEDCDSDFVSMESEVRGSGVGVSWAGLV